MKRRNFLPFTLPPISIVIPDSFRNLIGNIGTNVTDEVPHQVRDDTGEICGKHFALPSANKVEICKSLETQPYHLLQRPPPAN